jgi:hypothetical protein
MQTIEDFAHCVTDNMMSYIDEKECTNILEDFIKCNEHIIQKINKAFSSIIHLRLNIEIVNKIRNFKTQYHFYKPQILSFF